MTATLIEWLQEEIDSAPETGTWEGNPATAIAGVEDFLTNSKD